jgi:outer membrane biosynthesis protein TonB
VAKNEDGEFELVLGNNQLLSVFVLMVLLLVVCFVGGYFLGRKATPVINAAATANGAPVEGVRETEPTKIVDATKPSEEKKEETVPVRTAPQAEPEVAKTELPKSEPVKPEPKKEEPKQVAKVEPPKPEPKQETKAKAPEPVKPKLEPKAKPEPPKVEAKGKQPAGAQPIPGRIYLQLSATEKDKADTMVDLLKRRNLPGFAAAIPDRPGLYRVLVGPLAETGINDMKAQLKAGGFPADQAIRRQF